jgi:hypothetical protein
MCQLGEFKTVSKLDRHVAVLKYREKLKIQGRILFGRNFSVRHEAH